MAYLLTGGGFPSGPVLSAPSGSSGWGAQAFPVAGPQG